MSLYPRAVLILLPPSEGKTAPRRGAPLDLDTLSFPELTDARAEAVDALVSLCADDRVGAAAVLGLGPTQQGEIAANACLRSAPTVRADRLYSGVLYDALSVSTLDAAARRRASRWLVVTSALFGILRPQDRIPAYRLSGSVTLPPLGTIAAHWRAHLGPALEEAAGRGLVLDLRSSTYAAFWRPQADLAARTVTVRVLQEKDGRRTVVSHFNKATKGRLVRALLEDGRNPRDVDALAAQMTDLGFAVEPGTSAADPSLDVVVRTL